MVPTHSRSFSIRNLQTYYEKEYETLLFMKYFQDETELLCNDVVRSLNFPQGQLYTISDITRQKRFIFIMYGVYRILKSIASRKRLPFKHINRVYIYDAPLTIQQKCCWISHLCDSSIFELQAIKKFLRRRYIPQFLNYMYWIVIRLRSVLSRTKTQMLRHENELCYD